MWEVLNISQSDCKKKPNFFNFRNLQCDRNTIHKNLVLTLCLAEIVFLVGIIQYDRPVSFQVSILEIELLHESIRSGADMAFSR